MACTNPNTVTNTCQAISGDGIVVEVQNCPTAIAPGIAGSLFSTNDAGTGFCWRTISTHKPAHITNNAAAFEWDDASQCGNIPITKITTTGGGGSPTVIDIGDGTTVTIPHPSMVKNADGSYTYNPGDGTPSVTIPKDCCPTLVDNNDGTYTFTSGTGATVTIQGGGNFVETVTTLVQNADGTLTYTNEAGTAVTTSKVTETLTTLVNNGDQTFTYTNEAGTAVTIDLCAEVQNCVDVGAASRAAVQTITGGGATTYFAVNTMITDTTGGNMNGLANPEPGVKIVRTQRYNANWRGFFNGAAANTTGTVSFGVIRAGAYVNYDTLQFITDINGAAELRGVVTAALMQANDIVVAKITWNGATSGNLINENLRVAGHFKTS